MDSLTVPTVMRKAFRVAQLEKPGSVAIVIPENFLPQEIANKPLPIYPLPETTPVKETTQAALTLIQNRMKPFIIVGNGVVRQDAHAELQTFINTLQAPVTHSFMAKGASFDVALRRAYGALEGIVYKQASVLAYMDVFLYLGVLFLICIPFILMVRNKAGNKIDMSEAMH